MSEGKTCFVIAPIGEPESEARKRSDQILKHVITPAAGECGYNPMRADQISEPGIITSQVIQHIVEDPLVVADLTDRNPNVFYELAIRHAVKKPLVQIIQKGERIPFDVAATRTIPVDHRDLDSAEEAKLEIIRQIKAVEEDPSKIYTPISVALDLQILRQSENPEQRSLADIEKAVSEIRSTVLAVDQKLGDSKHFLTPKYLQFALNLYPMYLEACSGLDEIIEELSKLSQYGVELDIEAFASEVEKITDKLILVRNQIGKNMQIPLLY
jgi:hypothetical protein